MPINMTNIITIHPENPQRRLLIEVVDVLEAGGVIAYPTDSGYALGCLSGRKKPLGRIRSIRGLDKDHSFTLMCRDLSEISDYARIDNPTYRLLKKHTPGSYTFILLGTHALPKLLRHPKRKTIGVRVPLNEIALSLLSLLGQPMLSVSLVLPDEVFPLAELELVEAALSGQVELIVDGGDRPVEPTTIVDLTQDKPQIIREGRGDIDAFIWE